MKRAIAFVVIMLMGSLACSLSLPDSLGEKEATPIALSASVMPQGPSAPTLANGDLGTPSQGGIGAPTAGAAEPELGLRAWVGGRRETGMGTDLLQLVVGAENLSQDWWSYEVSNADTFGQHLGVCMWSVEPPVLMTSEGYLYQATNAPCGHMSYGALPPGVLVFGYRDTLGLGEEGVLNVFTFEIPQDAHPKSVSARYRSADSLLLTLVPSYGPREATGDVEGDLAQLSPSDLFDQELGQAYEVGEEIPLGEYALVRVGATNDDGDVDISLALTNLHDGYSLSVGAFDLYTSIYAAGVLCCRTLLSGYSTIDSNPPSGTLEIKVAPRQTREIHARFSNPDAIPATGLRLLLELRIAWDSLAHEKETHFALVEVTP